MKHDVNYYVQQVAKHRDELQNTQITLEENRSEVRDLEKYILRLQEIKIQQARSCEDEILIQPPRDS